MIDRQNGRQNYRSLERQNNRHNDRQTKAWNGKDRNGMINARITDIMIERKAKRTIDRHNG